MSGSFNLLSHAPHWGGELGGRLNIFRVRRQQMSIGDEHRATTAGIRDDREIPASGESVDVLTRQLARAFEVAGVGMQGAAADLACRCLDRAAVCAKYSGGGFVHSSEESVGYA